MGGGLLQLVTIGAQDVFISGDPQITFFKLVYKRHTNFAVESKSQISNTTLSSATTRTDIDIKREGDLINHMYLRILNPTSTDITQTCNTLAKTFITNVINQHIYVENASRFEKNMDIMITAGVYSSTNNTTPISVYRTTIIDIDYDSNILTITGKYPVTQFKNTYLNGTNYKLDPSFYHYSCGFMHSQTSGTIFAGTKCPFQVVEVRGHSIDGSWTACDDIWTAVSGIRGISGDMYSRPVLQRTLTTTGATGTTALNKGATVFQATSGFVGILLSDLVALSSQNITLSILVGTLNTAEILYSEKADGGTAVIAIAADEFGTVAVTNGFSNVSASGYVTEGLGGKNVAERGFGLGYDMIFPTNNTGSGVAWSATDGENSACCESNLNGYHMIEDVELLIGGTSIDKISGDLMDMWNELTITNGNKEEFRLMTSVEEGKYCYLPLYFWFNKSPGLALPLIALQYHEVKVRIRWKSNIPVPSQSAELFINYIYLDSAERRRFAQSTHQYLVETWQENDESIISDNTQTRLIFNHPVKELLWRARKNNGNYVSWNEITLKFNGSDRISTRHSDYYQRIQPFYHHSAIPNKIHGIHCYSFALKPEEHQPSGTCNFSRLDNVVLSLNGLRKYDGLTTDSLTQFSGSTTNTTIKLKVYALAYNVLNIMSGMGALAFAN